MSLRILRITAGGHQFTGQPIAAVAAEAATDQLHKAMAGSGDSPSHLVVLSEPSGFERTEIRARAITGFELLRVEDPGDLR